MSIVHAVQSAHSTCVVVANDGCGIGQPGRAPQPIGKTTLAHKQFRLPSHLGLCCVEALVSLVAMFLPELGAGFIETASVVPPPSATR